MHDPSKSDVTVVPLPKYTFKNDDANYCDPGKFNFECFGCEVNDVTLDLVRQEFRIASSNQNLASFVVILTT